MVKFIYTVRDTKSGFNSPLFLADYDELAIRDFRTIVNTPGSLLNQYPEDFELYCVGNIETKDGTIDGSCFKQICKGFEVVNKEK